MVGKAGKKSEHGTCKNRKERLVAVKNQLRWVKLVATRLSP
jgi:hypothetical protein